MKIAVCWCAGPTVKGRLERGFRFFRLGNVPSKIRFVARRGVEAGSPSVRPRRTSLRRCL